MDEAALGEAFVRAGLLQFPPVSIIPTLRRIHLFIYHGRKTE